MTVPELTIGVVPLLALIVALVEVIKRYWLKDVDGQTHRAVPLVAMGLGVLFATGIHLATIFPAFGAWYEIVVAGLVAGLSAVGLYSGGRHILNL